MKQMKSLRLKNFFCYDRSSSVGALMNILEYRKNSPETPVTASPGCGSAPTNTFNPHSQMDTRDIVGDYLKSKSIALANFAFVWMSRRESIFSPMPILYIICDTRMMHRWQKWTRWLQKGTWPNKLYETKHQCINVNLAWFTWTKTNPWPWWNWMEI